MYTLAWQKASRQPNIHSLFSSKFRPGTSLSCYATVPGPGILPGVPFSELFTGLTFPDPVNSTSPDTLSVALQAANSENGRFAPAPS